MRTKGGYGNRARGIQICNGKIVDVGIVKGQTCVDVSAKLNRTTHDLLVAMLVVHETNAASR